MTTKLIALLTILSPLLLLAMVSCVDANPHPQNTNPLLQPSTSTHRRVKRMYAVCPPEFKRIGNECYYLSTQKETWMEAHFNCVDRDSKLAEPFKFEDKRLRKYLLASGNHIVPSYKWIGGIYNWESKQWHWGHSGRNMTYKAFSRMQPGSSQDLKYHCAVLSPELEYRWSARLCTENQHYVCQHRMPYVSKRQLDKVYARWNVTFPNQLANEMEVLVTDPNNRQHNQLMRNKHKRRTQNQGTRIATITAPIDHHQQKMNKNPNDRPGESQVVPVLQRRRVHRNRHQNEVTNVSPGFLYGGAGAEGGKNKRRRPLVEGTRRKIKKRPTPAPAHPPLVFNEAPVEPVEWTTTSTQRSVPVTTTVSTTTRTTSTTLPTTTTLSTTSTTTQQPTTTTTRQTTTESVVISKDHPHHQTRHHNHHRHREWEQVEKEEERETVVQKHRHRHQDSESHLNEVDGPVIPIESSTTTTTPSTTTLSSTTTTAAPVTTIRTSTEMSTSPAPKKEEESNAVHEKTLEEKTAEKRKRVEALKLKFSKMSKEQQARFLALQHKRLQSKLVNQATN